MVDLYAYISLMRYFIIYW